MNNKYRLEHDSIGEKEVPIDAYYGVQTLRSKENFDITHRNMHPEMIKALAYIKKACAITNSRAGLLEKEKEHAIVQACDEILEGNFWDQFISDPIQGGAGTSANMNANEVIANRANQILGGELGKYDKVHPNDDVNMGQSTNDVYPSAGKIGALNILPKLESEISELVSSLFSKASEFDDVIKMGRTQLQDAVPIRLGQEFHAYASLLKRDLSRIEKAKISLENLNMGASAIGTGINVDLMYFMEIVPEISRATGLPLRQASDLVDATSNLDGVMEMSSALKILAIDLNKICNDLRLMSSGPRTMISDIVLPPRQNGSSIMPGKVNPVIPEVVNQVGFRVIGNDVTAVMCAEAGQMELNAFEPVLFHTLYESIDMMTNAVNTFRINCINGIKANREKLKNDLEKSVGMVTALVPHIGYEKSAEIVKIAEKTNKTIRSIVLELGYLTEAELNEILDPWAMTRPGIAAKHLLKEKKHE